MRWYARIGRKVWLSEVWEFLTQTRHVERGPTLEAFWGAPQVGEQEALSLRKDVARQGEIGPPGNTSAITLVDRSAA